MIEPNGDSDPSQNNRQCYPSKDKVNFGDVKMAKRLVQNLNSKL
jgi:hypothetical protein